MRILYYGYNSFLIKTEDKKIAIDPGGELYIFRWLKSIIPRSEWNDVTHIFVTHGDPDHHWHTDRLAKISNASVICNKTMVKEIDGRQLMIGPRNRGLAFTSPFEKLYTVSVDETIHLDGMSILGIKTTHGAITFSLGSFSKTLKPGTKERVGWGAIGFLIHLDDKYIVNLGDTLLKEREWMKINAPDVLMIPIGGAIGHNTMNEKEALQAVRLMKPKLVIPCHYNCPFLLHKNANPADYKFFKKEAEKLGTECVILRNGESIDV